MDYNQEIIKAINSVLDKAIQNHARVMVLRVDLRRPSSTVIDDLPITFVDDDDAVISRFIRSLQAKLDAQDNRLHRQRLRIYPCRLRYVWVRELSQQGYYHYHLLIILNKDRFYCLGDYNNPDSLAGMIASAWCSALRVHNGDYIRLAHFPDNAVYHLNRRDEEQFHHQKSELLYRALYLAKNHSKPYGTQTRTFGCSRG